MAEPAVNEADLAELQAFLSGACTTGAAPAVGSDAAPTSSGGYFDGSQPAAPAGAMPLPPGFEDFRSGLVGESTAVVQVQSSDPTERLLAAKSWDELNLSKEILDGIFEMGFVRPSKIQEWALPIALNGGSMIAQAENGSGKTAAFALSMLVCIDLNYSCPQGLCLCPTRELAVQNHDVIKNLGKFTGVQMFLAIPQGDRPRSVTSHVVVGTPGKVQDLIKRKQIDASWMKMLVIDEADNMINEENQMGPQVLAIKNLLPPSENMQVLLFSATWPEHVNKFAHNMAHKPYRISVEKEKLTLDTITQTFIEVAEDPSSKVQKLCDLYGSMTIGQSIIFVNTREKAWDLAEQMKKEGHAVSLICGTQKTGAAEMIDPSERDRVMKEFREGVTRVLVATDVLARGIDVPAVTLVVNYEIPMGRNRRPECETYIHRIGRTGRFGLRGVAVNLITGSEKWALKEIESFYQVGEMRQLTGDLDEMEGLLRGLRC